MTNVWDVMPARRLVRLTGSNDFNFGMDKTKAAYLPFEQAFPFQYVIDGECLFERLHEAVLRCMQVQCNRSQHETRDDNP